jgi:hypothetical protein
MSSTTESAQMQSPVIKGTSFTPATQVTYAKAKLNKAGGKAVGIRLMLETPLMLTWGAQKFTDEVSGRTTYNMALQFPRDEYATKDTETFLNALIEMETKIKADAITNSMEWFNKPKSKMTPDVVDALFHPMLTWSKDPSTGERDVTKKPTLKVKLECWDNAFNCELYDTAGRKLFPPQDESSDVSPLTLIPKAINIACVLQSGGLWFAGGKFGHTFKLFQGVVQPKPSLKGKCLISLSSKDIKTLEKAVNNSEESEEVLHSSAGVEIADDSDIEEEVVVRRTPAPVQQVVAAPAPVQQVVAAPVPVQQVAVAEVVAATPAPVVKKTMVKRKVVATE